jgi:hypothetical protein
MRKEKRTERIMKANQKKKKKKETGELLAW